MVPRTVACGGETALPPERTSGSPCAPKEGVHGGTMGSAAGETRFPPRTPFFRRGVGTRGNQGFPRAKTMGSPTLRPRAAIVVTGSELVRGERTDLNGPFLAQEALSLGLEPARITIVGDRPNELEAALRQGLEADLCLVTGGLGPTHDDRTVELVAKAAGRGLVLDPDLHREIGDVSRAVAERLRRPYADFEDGVRKQATLPEGAISLGLAGTAPGMVLEAGRAAIVVLPGPPAELRRLWPRALSTGPVRRVLEQARPPGRRVLRFYGASESAVAKALADAGGDGEGVEATICARDFEIHVDLLVEPGAGERADDIERGLIEPLARYLFTRDERPVEELVLGLCRARGWTLATAESSTGGLLAGRLTSVAGSSDVFVGGIVAYANEVKERELRVSASTLAEHGAVSPETAAAMAAGVRARLHTDVGISVTGIAGPGGGTPQKPVGLVYLRAETPERGGELEFNFPADRESIRRRATVAALHLLLRVLAQNGDELA
jgi:competence/damage-inducible protein CinA-like protein